MEYPTSKYLIKILFTAEFIHQLLRHLEEENQLDIFNAGVEGYFIH